MNRPELKAILQNTYDRSQWISTLQFLTGKRELLSVNLSPREIEIHTQEADRLVKSFHQIGTLKTSDGASLPIFEIILEDDIRIEHNRVGVNEFIKKYIIKDAIKGALATFSYDDNHEKTEWRFSFISKNSASDFFAEAEAIETNPKKYTYIFGNKEEHRTAIERLYNLEQSRFRLEDFFEAFNVEPVSKKFFEEYKQLYREFSNFIVSDKKYLSLFENSNDESVKPEKEIRNFVSRLLGRMVFLYFLQKKNWLGASSTEYKDGSTTFLSDLFFEDEKNQNDFYNKYLCPIFFEALNTADRKNDAFKLENGKTVCIPFLNGGLFEEEQEPNGHRGIKIPAFQFKMLFDFFNGFNFTVYENSPEEHTVAVDPEMLGHIFENLIDYNKDTGTFYTPKEIVQYMTQESLIEYLNTHLQKNRFDIENMVKNQTANHFEDEELIKINQLLDDVKICDPAIGSGAFPMGMLQEIFNLKALINFKLGFDVWSPATVKQNIIQNSIYGVDLDEGAVEIARLRFWLSLVVDEGMPKALPNLDYKIMQGNSLLESFRGIDLSNLEDVREQGITEQSVIDYGQEFATQITLFDSLSYESLKQLVKEYFTAGNTGSRSKSIIKNQIDEYIESKIHAKIFWEKDRYKTLIDQFYKKYNIQRDNDLAGFNLKSKELKELFDNLKKFDELSAIENELLSFQTKKERPYFLWHLYFADVLDKGGFDIVIGNPPYVDIKGLDNDFVKVLFKNYNTTLNRINLYSIFIEKGKSLMNINGVLSYIIPNSLLVNDSYIKTRQLIIDNLVQVIKLPDSIFEKAIVETIIILLSQKTSNKYIDTVYFKNDEITNLVNIDFNKYLRKEWKDDLQTKFNIFRNTEESKILSLIETNSTPLSQLTQFSLGITPYDKAKGHSQNDIKEKVFHSDEKLSEEYVPLVSGKNIKKYHIDNKITEYLKYGVWLGAPRNEKFFKEPKIVVRQILNGTDLSIIAGYSELEIYFTQIAFSIISAENSEINLKYILAILNSKTISFYHKYKYLDTEKIVFPKILIANCKKFPIVIDYNCTALLPKLVDFVIYTKKEETKLIDNIDNEHIANFFEELIDAVVFEIYFPKEMNEKDLLVTEDIKCILDKIFAPVQNEEIAPFLNNLTIAMLYMTFKESQIQQKMRKFVTASPNVLKVILQN